MGDCPTDVHTYPPGSTRLSLPRALPASSTCPSPLGLEIAPDFKVQLRCHLSIKSSLEHSGGQNPSIV